jgi:heat shock protein HslJ
MKLASFPALVLLSLAMVMFNACSNTGASLTGEWTLVSYGDATNPTPAVADVDTSITFDGGQFGGNVGCNSFGADYTADGDSIHIGSVVSTMMFCEATSAQESAVLGIVSDKTLKVSLNGNQLTLATEDGDSVIVLEKK